MCALKLRDRASVIFLHLGRSQSWASHFQTELLAEICIQVGPLAGLCSHLVRQGCGECSLACCPGSAVVCILGNEQGHTLSSTFIYGCMGPQAMPPDLMTPLARLCIQLKPYTELYDQTGTQGVLLDQIGTYTVPQNWVGL